MNRWGTITANQCDLFVENPPLTLPQPLINVLNVMAAGAPPLRAHRRDGPSIVCANLINAADNFIGRALRLWAFCATDYATERWKTRKAERSRLPVQALHPTHG